jgi:monoamine oxidase
MLALVVACAIRQRGWPGLTAGSFDDGRTDIPGEVVGPVERVVVVGAGIAGLTVANALAHGGVECVVVEARDRIGGRLHTVDLARSPVDLGGSWIHTPIGNPDACLRGTGRCLLPQREPIA